MFRPRGQRELDQRAQDWLIANSPKLATEATGISIIFAHLSINNVISMLPWHHNCDGLDFVDIDFCIQKCSYRFYQSRAQFLTGGY